MNIPNSYVAWVDTLENLKNSPKNEMLLSESNKSKMKLEGDATIRFINKVEDLIQYRLNIMLNKFIGKLETLAIDNNSFSLELLEIKKEYRYLINIAKLNIIPKENSNILVASLKTQAIKVEKKLEEETKRVDRTGMLFSILKSNKISDLEG